MEEIWKPVNGFENKYLVSNHGEVKSLFNNKILKGFIDVFGYHQVLFGKTHKKMHRLVAEHFIPNPENKRCVNHLDSVKTNNHISNLEWATHSENTIHQFSMGYKVAEMENRWNSNIDETQILCIRACISEGIPKKELASYFNINVATINRCLSGKHWIFRKHPGLHTMKGFIRERSIPVLFYPKEGGCKEYRTMKEASIDTGVSRSGISNNVKGLIKKTRKGIFKLVAQ